MEITQDVLNELLHYNPETGELRWNSRQSKMFNKRYAGKQAGYIKHDSRCSHYKRILIRTPDGKQKDIQNVIWCMVYGYWPKSINRMIDHIDGNTLNNKLSNLRLVDHLMNNQNSKKRRDNSSGVTGVHFSNRSNKWVSMINVNRKRIHLGYFDNFEDAIKVRKEAEVHYGFHENHGRD